MRTALMTAGTLCVLATGCGRESYIESMAGDWSGTAINAGAPVVISASFTWDDDADEENFGGSLTLDGWTYVVWTANSDREFAQVELFHDLGARKIDLADVLVDRKEGAMEGNFSVNTCYENRQPLAEQDPASCVQAGTFSMEEGALPTASDALVQ